MDAVATPLLGVGGLLAAGLVAGLVGRRRLQLQSRPVGRRIPQPPPAAQLVEAVFGRRQRPVTLRTLDRASRAIAAHCRRAGTGLPRLRYALVGGEQIELVLSEPRSDAPVGFTVRGHSWLLDQADAGYLSSVPGLSEAPRPWPALVTLGRDTRDRLVVADLETMGLLGLQSPGPDVSDGVLAGLAVELSFSPWADEMILTLVDDPALPGRAAQLPEALGRHNVGRTADVDALLDRLEKRAAAQRAELTQVGLGQRRVDPDLADPWAPEIVLLGRTLDAARWARLTAVLTAEPRVTMAAVVVDPAGTTPWRLEARDSGGAVLQPVGMELVPQHLDRPTASALVDLIETTGSEATTSAPWWDPGPALPPRHPTGPPPDNVTFLGRRFGGWGLDPESAAEDDPGQKALRALGESGGEAQEDTGETSDVIRAEGARMRAVAEVLAGEAEHPVLRLLGPVELVHPAGDPPPRAGKQCLEYCAWLLEHPGTTAQAMASALVVAEGTRRSNMSRLRSWLGHDASGEAYLPDAYTGRIVLHPAVSSDWLHLQVLTTGGVNRADTQALRAALDLVRGAPLADAAPGQWHWAEELRTDMVSCLRDIGVELANRALDRGELDLARWAASRALVAAPGDELLMAARIRTEHRAGNPAETERLTLQLAAQARSLGVDLEVETVVLMQQVMEGRVRARMA